MGLGAILQDSNRVPASSPCGTALCWDSGRANDSALVKIRNHSGCTHSLIWGYMKEVEISESVNILAFGSRDNYATIFRRPYDPNYHARRIYN